MQDLIEVKDGLLASPDKSIMKARDPELFPDLVREYFRDKTKVRYNRIEIGLDRVKVKINDKVAVFDKDLFDYLQETGRIDCYLSNVPLPGEDVELYPLFAKYRWGWICLAPMVV